MRHASLASSLVVEIRRRAREREVVTGKGG
jgi:hypothetical protein